MIIFLQTVGLVILIVVLAVVITKWTKKCCEDDFNPDNW